MDRVYNVEKKRKRNSDGASDCAVPAKRGRPHKGVNLHDSRYPPIQATAPDEDSDSRNLLALVRECEKDKPRKDLVMQLMKDTCEIH